MMSCRSDRSRLQGDRGFTVVEVMIAAAVLFFAATALLGLMAASTTMSVKSKEDAVAVSVASSFIERVRGLTFDQVTQENLDLLAAEATSTVKGIDVAVSCTITPMWFDEQDPDTEGAAYKYVQVTVTATGPVGTPFTMTTATYVRRGLAGGDESELPEAPPPTVTLRTGTPTTGAIYGSQWLGMDAVAGGLGTTLTYLNFTAGGSLVLETSSTATADSLTGYWDTTTWADGVYEMRARARDNKGQTGDVAWSLIVDNVLPDMPGTISRSAVNGLSSVTHSWAAAKDGAGVNDWAIDYEMTPYVQSATGSTFSALAPQVVVPASPEGPVEGALSTTGLKRYYVVVRTRGARATFGDTASWMSDPVTGPYFISRPSMAASSVVLDKDGGPSKKAILDMTLRCDSPGFGTTGTTYYRWQYSYAGGTWTDFEITQVPQLVRNDWTAPANGKFSDKGIKIRCVVNTTPSGGANVRIPSGVTEYKSSTPGPIDWTRWVQEPVYTPAIDWAMWLQ